MSTVSVPSGTTIKMFVPTADFAGFARARDGGQLLGHYAAGERYWLRAGNDVLRRCLADWKKDGLVVVIDLEG